MKSKNVTTLTRAMNHPHKISTTSTLSTDIESQLGASNSDLSRKSSGDGGGKLRRSIRALKRGSGIEAVKDLWQQTGKRLKKMPTLITSIWQGMVITMSVIKVGTFFLKVVMGNNWTLLFLHLKTYRK